MREDRDSAIRRFQGHRVERFARRLTDRLRKLFPGEGGARVPTSRRGRLGTERDISSSPREWHRRRALGTIRVLLAALAGIGAGAGRRVIVFWDDTCREW